MKRIFPVYHIAGCRGIAFYSLEKLIEGVSTLDSKTVIKVDGTIPIDNCEQMICGSCGQPFSGGEVNHDKDKSI